MMAGGLTDGMKNIGIGDVLASSLALTCRAALELVNRIFL